MGYAIYRTNLTKVRCTPNQPAHNQQSLWGDTYLTPQEARIYITQMLQTLQKHRTKTGSKK